MTRNFLLVIFSGIIITMLSCNAGNEPGTAENKSATPAFDMAKARSFIDSINIKFSEEFRKGDSAALASHYSEDAELLLSNSEAIKGKDILTTWGSMTRMGIKDFTFTTTDLSGDENFLIETGMYEMKDSNNKLVDKGKYVVVWKKQDNGDWKLFRDIGNTSMPAPTPK